MIHLLENVSNLFKRRTVGLPLVRPKLGLLNSEDLPKTVQECPVCQKYLRLLGTLDWKNFPKRPSKPGIIPEDRRPYLAAYLVKINQKLTCMSDLRTYLLEHPTLVWLLGFPLVPDLQSPWGFDVPASVPTRQQFVTVLRTVDNQLTQFLLNDTIRLIREALPADTLFGDVISLDTKHVIAWVKENNPKTYIKQGRYDKHKQPNGDKDCKLGVKRQRNQFFKGNSKTPLTNPQPASKIKVSEYFWGYASGIVVTKIPAWGEIVLAELTQTFDESDVSYFFPLMQDAEQRLGFRPHFGTFDAAFDAWYVYQYFYEVGGVAAVPLAERYTKQLACFDSLGPPLCRAGLRMTFKSSFRANRGLKPHKKSRYVCPLDLKQQSCPIQHAKVAKGGCTTTFIDEPGAIIRHLIDRKAPWYKKFYNQRTATERINSQAKEFGIERPKLRNQQAIINFNSLIYVLINLRTWQRIQKRLSRITNTSAVSIPC